MFLGQLSENSSLFHSGIGTVLLCLPHAAYTQTCLTKNVNHTGNLTERNGLLCDDVSCMCTTPLVVPFLGTYVLLQNTKYRFLSCIFHLRPKKIFSRRSNGRSCKILGGATSPLYYRMYDTYTYPVLSFVTFWLPKNKHPYLLFVT